MSTGGDGEDDDHDAPESTWESTMSQGGAAAQVGWLPAPVLEALPLVVGGDEDRMSDWITSRAPTIDGSCKAITPVKYWYALPRANPMNQDC